MSLHLHWYLPTNGDSREIVGSGDDSHLGNGPSQRSLRAPTLDYLADVARAAERAGFEAVLTPTGTWCEDAWITTAALSQLTRRIRFLVAFRPGLISPTLAAHQAATFQRLTGGRLLLNIVTGGDPLEQKRFGDHFDHDQRYERTREFLTILRGLAAVAPDRRYDFAGRHYQIEGAQIGFGEYGLPPLFFGGASPAAEDVAAETADVWLIWGEGPREAGERLARVRRLAEAKGRRISVGIRLHVIGRETEKLAWQEAQRLISTISLERVTKAHEILARTQSVGQQVMTALATRHAEKALAGGDVRALEVSPNLWAGYGLVRGGAGTALVGSHAQVADRIAEYHALGFEHFILSGQPHIEEAWAFGEGAGAILRDRGLVATG